MVKRASFAEIIIFFDQIPSYSNNYTTFFLVFYHLFESQTFYHFFPY